MKVKGLDGRTHNLDLTGHVPLGSEQVGSSGHVRARKLLEELFPLDIRPEEVALPGTPGPVRADFLLPRQRLVVEVQGRQHKTFVLHFHKTRLGFLQSLKRDQLKAEWCELNSVRYVALDVDDTDAEWRRQILDSGGTSD